MAGSNGAKGDVHYKEQADHNLRYILAAMLLDGEVWPEQYAPERINRGDVQDLLGKVKIEPQPSYATRIPEQSPARVTIRLRDGRKLERELSDYEGFSARPMSWEQVKTAASAEAGVGRISPVRA